MVISRSDDGEMFNHVLENIITLVKPNEKFGSIAAFLKFHGVDNFTLLMELDETDLVGSPPYQVFPINFKVGDPEPPELNLNQPMLKGSEMSYDLLSTGCLQVWKWIRSTSVS